jgi:hypothetical protein
MTKRFALAALAFATVLTGCGQAPVTAALHTAKQVARPSVTPIRNTAFAANLNDHQYDDQIVAARQAIAGEMVKQGLQVPAELATRHVAATTARVTAVKITGPNGGTLTAAKATGPNGGSIGAVKAVGPNGGTVTAIGAKGPNGGEVAAIGAKGPNGGEAGVIAAKGPDGGKAIVAGAKDANGNAVVAGAAQGPNGGAVAFEGAKGANGAEAGKWVATDGNGTTAMGAAATDGQGNAMGGSVVTKDGKVVAQRWIKAADGNALLETVAYDPATHVLVYSLTALVNGKPVTATATVVLPA